MEFPSWVYHRDGREVIVDNPEQLKALGTGWEDTPAKFAKNKKTNGENPKDGENPPGDTKPPDDGKKEEAKK